MYIHFEPTFVFALVLLAVWIVIDHGAIWCQAIKKLVTSFFERKKERQDA